MDIQDAKFRDEMKLKKSKISDKEYQLLMKKHKDEQDEISKMLASERERMEKTLQDKLATRKFRMPSARERVVSKNDVRFKPRIHSSCCGALSKVPIQIYIFLIEVSLIEIAVPLQERSSSHETLAFVILLTIISRVVSFILSNSNLYLKLKRKVCSDTM